MLLVEIFFGHLIIILQFANLQSLIARLCHSAVLLVNVKFNQYPTMILSAFAPKSLSFGEQELTDSMFNEQVMITMFVVFPLALILGHLSLRICTHPLLPFLRADIWNAIVRLIMADIVIELLQQSLDCVPFEEEGDLQELLMQSFGYGCPLYARALNPKAAGMVYGMRLVAVLVGLFWGEGWMPVAITGGVATGKSTVSTQLVEGKEEEAADNDNVGDDDDDNEEKVVQLQEIVGGSVYLIDTDKIAHTILLESTAFNVHGELVSTFGEDILGEEGVIDRKKLGAIVFGDASMRRKLNKITHPRIVTKMLQKMFWGLFASGEDITLCDVPLLFEAGFLTRSLFCLTVCVTCTPEQELERLIARNPELTKEECEARIKSQMPLEKKAKMADIVIKNTGDLKSLSEQVEEVRDQIMWRLFGVGLTLFQITAIMGISLPGAIYYRLFRNQPEDMSN
jgi:dephospho-CoA kinase